MPYITKAGLKQLDNYKYVGGAYSWLDNKMNPFWEWSVRLLPEVLPSLPSVDGSKSSHVHRVGVCDPVVCGNAVLRLHLHEDHPVVDLLLRGGVHFHLPDPGCHRREAGPAHQEQLSLGPAVRSRLRLLLDEFLCAGGVPGREDGA